MTNSDFYLTLRGGLLAIHSGAPIVPPNALLPYTAKATKCGYQRELPGERACCAAEILGINSGVDRIEVGKGADLVLLSGDPFNALTHMETELMDYKIVFNVKDFYEKTK